MKISKYDYVQCILTLFADICFNPIIDSVKYTTFNYYGNCETGTVLLLFAFVPCKDTTS